MIIAYTECSAALVLGVRVGDLRQWRKTESATGRRVGPSYMVRDGRVFYPTDRLHAWLLGATT